MKKNIRRGISLMLVVCSLLSIMPVMATAAEQKAAPEKIVYDFVMQDNTELVDTNNNSLGNGILTNAAVKNAIDAYYAAGTMSWKFAANNYSLLQTQTNVVKDASYFGGSSCGGRNGRRNACRARGINQIRFFFSPIISPGRDYSLPGDIVYKK